MDERRVPDWFAVLVDGDASSRRRLCAGEFCSVKAAEHQPWVFFNLPPPDFPSARRRRAEREEREAAAAASGHGGEPKQDVHHDPPSLEQAIANLKVELGAE